MINGNINYTIPKLLGQQKVPPQEYSLTWAGFGDDILGDKVKICILGSGRPECSEVGTYDVENFTNDKKDIDEEIGLSSLVFGVISGHGDVKGAAPKSYLLHAKVIDSKRKCYKNNLVAGILWAVIKNADVILIPFGLSQNSELIMDAIKKAYEANCSIVCVGKHVGKTNKIIESLYLLPTFYTYSAKDRDMSLYRNLILAGLGISLPKKRFYSTFLDNLYGQIPNYILTASLVTAICALTIGEYRHNQKMITPTEVYNNIFSKIDSGK